MNQQRIHSTHWREGEGRNPPIVDISLLKHSKNFQNFPFGGGGRFQHCSKFMTFFFAYSSKNSVENTIFSPLEGILANPRIRYHRTHFTLRIYAYNSFQRQQFTVQRLQKVVSLGSRPFGNGSQIVMIYVHSTGRSAFITRQIVMAVSTSSTGSNCGSRISSFPKTTITVK